MTLALAEQIRSVVADILGVDAARIGIESSPDSIPEWTSLAHVNLVLTLESEFGVAFSPEEVLELTSLVAIERLVRPKLRDEASTRPDEAGGLP